MDAVASRAVNFFPLGLPWDLGHDALGHSHLTYCDFGRVSLHLLDRLPSLYEINVPPDTRGVNGCFCGRRTKVYPISKHFLADLFINLAQRPYFAAKSRNLAWVEYLGVDRPPSISWIVRRLPPIISDSRRWLNKKSLRNCSHRCACCLRSPFAA